MTPCKNKMSKCSSNLVYWIIPHLEYFHRWTRKGYRRSFRLVCGVLFLLHSRGSDLTIDNCFHFTFFVAWQDIGEIRTRPRIKRMENKYMIKICFLHGRKFSWFGLKNSIFNLKKWVRNNSTSHLTFVQCAYCCYCKCHSNWLFGPNNLLEESLKTLNLWTGN